MWLEHTTKEAPMKMKLMSDENEKQLIKDATQLVKDLKGKTAIEQQRMMKAAPIWVAAAAGDWMVRQRLAPDWLIKQLSPPTPQNKALVKKPQRTKAPVSFSIPRSTRSRKQSKPAFETQMEQTLLAAVVKYGNNYQLAKLAGTSADIVSRFARKERTLRFDTAAQIADALGLRFQ